VRLAALEVEAVRVVPSGFLSVTVTVPTVLLVTRTVICWPAVPLKVNAPFWPGVVSVTVTAEPPIVSVPVTSAGTSYSVRVRLPVLVPLGSMVTV
jgi:hypothetical protein